MQNFRRPERQALVEYVTLENDFSDTPAGRTMVPGHAIESMWFVMQIYRHTGNKQRLREAAETIRWATEQGWDKEFGGLYLAIDIDGKEPLFWNNADTKIWWVFSEALYALLVGQMQDRGHDDEGGEQGRQDPRYRDRSNRLQAAMVGDVEPSETYHRGA